MVVIQASPGLFPLGLQCLALCSAAGLSCCCIICLISSISKANSAHHLLLIYGHPLYHYPPCSNPSTCFKLILRLNWIYTARRDSPWPQIHQKKTVDTIIQPNWAVLGDAGYKDLTKMSNQLEKSLGCPVRSISTEFLENWLLVWTWRVLLKGKLKNL